MTASVVVMATFVIVAVAIAGAGALLWLRKTHGQLPIVSHEIIVTSYGETIENRSILMEEEIKRLSVMVVALLEDGQMVAIDLRRRFLLIPTDPLIVDTDGWGKVLGVSQGRSTIFIKSKHPKVMTNEIIGSRSFIVPATPFSVEIILVSKPGPTR